VRELRNVARRIVIDNVDQPAVRTAPPFQPPHSEHEDAHGIQEVTEAAAIEARTAGRRALESIDEREILEALARHDYRPGPAASELGVSRTSLYALIERSPNIRKSADLSETEIADALARAEGNLERAAGALAVSHRGLRLRMKQLGMS
jgi:two-component system nitrogen regulation response regulator GlnG